MGLKLSSVDPTQSIDLQYLGVPLPLPAPVQQEHHTTTARMFLPVSTMCPHTWIFNVVLWSHCHLDEFAIGVKCRVSRSGCNGHRRAVVHLELQSLSEDLVSPNGGHWLGYCGALRVDQFKKFAAGQSLASPVKAAVVVGSIIYLWGKSSCQAYFDSIECVFFVFVLWYLERKHTSFQQLIVYNSNS